jgi:hypothetical protein
MKALIFFDISSDNLEIVFRAEGDKSQDITASYHPTGVHNIRRH